MRVTKSLSTERIIIEFKQPLKQVQGDENSIITRILLWTVMVVSSG